MKALFAVVVILSMLAMVCAPEAPAATLTWQVSSGDWSIASNWGVSLPLAGDTAYIINGTTANIVQSGETCDTLSLGSSAGAGSVLMTAGGLSVVSYEYIGNSGIGNFVQSGGMNMAPGEVNVGFSVDSCGAYSLSANGQLTSPYENIGNSGSGSFTQSGGTNSTGSLYIGFHNTSSGTYGLTAAASFLRRASMLASTPAPRCSSRAAASIARPTSASAAEHVIFSRRHVADSRPKHFYRRGNVGRRQRAGSLVIGGSNIIDLSHGALVNASSLAVSVGSSSLLIVPSGFDPATGFGQLINSGMVHVAGTVLNVNAGQTIIGNGTIYDLTACHGAIAASGGPINLLGGVALPAAEMSRSAAAALSTDLTSSSMSGGSLSASYQYVGINAFGSFVQSGGMSSIGSLYIGYNNSSSGTYSLSGSGVLSAQSEYIGVNSASALFQQSGGSNSTPNLSINNGAHYLLQRRDVEDSRPKQLLERGYVRRRQRAKSIGHGRQRHH